MRKQLLVASSIALLSVTSCKKTEEVTPDVVTGIKPGEGLFIVNEGGFQNNNASLSYLNYSSNTVSNNIFEGENGEPLGDAFQSMLVVDNSAYLVVSNSNKVVEVTLNNTAKAKELTCSGDPRNAFYNATANELWVTQYGTTEPNILVFDKSSGTVKEEIDLANYDEQTSYFPSGSDELLSYNGKVYITNFRTEYVYQINASSYEVEDSLWVGYGAQYLELVDDKLWIATSGDWNKQTSGMILAYDLTSNTMTFEKVDASGFSYLTQFNDVIYMLNNGVKSIASGETELTEVVALPEGVFFYGMNVNPTNGEIWTTDAVDYTQNGKLMHYSSTGSLENSYDVGVIPSKVVFY